MGWWNDRRVSVRLTVAFAVAGLCCLLLLGASHLQQRRADAALTELTEVDFAHLREVLELQTLAAGTTARVIALNVSKDPAIGQLFGPEVGPRVVRINELRDKLRVWTTSPEEQAWAKDLDASGARIIAALGAIAKARAAGDDALATQAFSTEFMPNVKVYDDLLDRLVEMQKAKSQHRVAELKQAGWSQWWALAGAAGLVLAVVGLLVTTLVRKIGRSLEDAIRVAGEVAGGNLAVTADTRGRDEFAELNRSLVDMAAGLRTVVQRVRGGTDQMATATQEIAQGNQDLSQRTERQAGHLQQTASTMEQLAVTVRQTADSAAKANSLSDQAREIAERSGHAVSQIVETMGEIEQSSQRVQEIVAVIDGISFQTNILALNAAVEAARAGEQGRGFAVVAGEVRQLAQRSAGAAKEIRQLIADSSEKVRNGSSQVREAGRTMQDLQDAVRCVTTLIAEISLAAAEQRGGIAGVSNSVNELDQSTQQNSALVEESAAAASALQDLASSLAQTVSVFRVEAKV